MLRLSKPQFYTVRSLNNCLVSLLHNNKTLYKGIIRRYKNKKDKKNIYYRLNNMVLKANIVYLSSKPHVHSLIHIKNKRFAKKITLPNSLKKTIYYYKPYNYKVDFYVHEKESIIYKREIGRRKKRQIGVVESVQKMHRLYGQKYFVLIINKSGWYYQCPLIDAFFIGDNDYNIIVNEKRYRCDHFVIDVKTLIDGLLASRKRYAHFMFVQELFEQTPIYFKNSVLFNILQKTKHIFKKILKERDIRNEKRKNQTRSKSSKEVKSRTNKKVDGSQKKTSKRITTRKDKKETKSSNKNKQGRVVKKARTKRTRPKAK